MSDELIINGGRRVSKGGAPHWDFGWRPVGEEAAAAVFGEYAADPPPLVTGDKVFLWLFTKSVNNGVLPPYNWQLSGSCVNGGGQNALIERLGVIAATTGRVAAFKLPFTLLAYGQSRADQGWDYEGEGSNGVPMAVALGAVGAGPIDSPALPDPHYCGPALVYDRAVELHYSAARNATAAERAACKPFALQQTRIRNLDQAEAKLRAGCPLSFAGDWGSSTRMGTKGNREPVLFGEHSGSWGHQQSCPGLWHHPELGRIWCIRNQWYGPGPDMRVTYIRTPDGNAIDRITQAGTAVPVHGVCPVAPPGAYWIDDRSMTYQITTGQVVSYDDFTGYPGVLDFGNI